MNEPSLLAKETLQNLLSSLLGTYSLVIDSKKTALCSHFLCCRGCGSLDSEATAWVNFVAPGRGGVAPGAVAIYFECYRGTVFLGGRQV